MTVPDAAVWTVVAVMGVGTVALRGSFLFLFERLGTVPPRVERALRFVPAAVLAALVFPAVFAPEGAVTLLGNDRLAAAAVASAVAWYTESLLATIVAGLVAIVAIGVL